MSKCIDPVLCYNSPTGRKFRHFSLASPMFKALHDLVFNCGTCIFCRKRKAAELASRCVLHASLYKHNSFLTLTYDEKREGYHNVFQYSDIQGFKKRLRSHVWYHFEEKVQLFNVHEYGRNQKKHWHLVCFGFDFPDRVLYNYSSGNGLFKSELLSELWPFGFSTIGNVSEASAMYQAQYAQKDLKNGNSCNERKSHSKHSGIGREYFMSHYRQILSLGYVPFGNRRMPIPRYFLKLAHRHYCHFHEPSAFHDLPYRKALYRPLKDSEALRDMSDLYQHFLALRQDFLKTISEEWEEEVFKDLFDKELKDFQKSGLNFEYDLFNKNSLTEF